MPELTQPARPRLSPALGTVALLLALNLLNYIDRYILSGEVSPIQREFHATDQQMGALGTAFFLFYMIAAPLTGWLGDRFRRKPLIIAGAVLWSLATLAALWVHSYSTLYLRQALVGIGEATFGIFAPAVLATSIPSATATACSPFSTSPFPWARRSATWPADKLDRTGAGARHFSFARFPAFWSPPSMDGSGASHSAAPATTSKPTSAAPLCWESFATPHF